MARETARTYDEIELDGTTSEAWERPPLEAYADALGIDAERVADLDPEDARRIAATSGEGSANADTVDELISFPLGITRFNENAAESARTLRHLANDPGGMERLTRQILNEEFGRDLEPPEESAHALKQETFRPPQDVADRAQEALDLRDETGNPGSCGTQVGWQRANQLANREPVSAETVQRMQSFLSRHLAQVDGALDEQDPESCQRMMILAWGGEAGLDWVESTLQQLEEMAMQKADPDELSEGDLVRWDSSGGLAYGQVEEIETDGTIEAQPEGPTMDGTEDDPAFLIRVHDFDGEEWAPTDTLVVHRAAALTIIDSLPETRAMTTKQEPDTFDDPFDASARADEIGCDGIHVHEGDGDPVFMPCATHEAWEEHTSEMGGHDDDEMGGHEDQDYHDEDEMGGRGEKTALDRIEAALAGETKSTATDERRMTFQTKSLEVKEETEEEFTFEAYGAVFGNKDRGGDILQKGAMQQTINRNDGKFPLITDHQMTMKNRLGVVYAEEDSHGVRVTGHVNKETRHGREVASHIRHAQKHDTPIGMSFGFKVVKDDYDPERKARIIKEVKTFEFSLTQIPENPEARVTGVKSFLDDDAALQKLARQLAPLLAKEDDLIDPLRKEVGASGASDPADGGPSEAELIDELQSINDQL